MPEVGLQCVIVVFPDHTYFFGPVLCYRYLYTFKFCNHLTEKERAVCFTLVVFFFYQLPLIFLHSNTFV